MIYLLGDWLIQKLLMFDMVLHTSIVRETFANVNVLDFIEQGGIIVCSGPIIAKNYFERTMKHIMLNEPSLEREMLTGNLYHYSFHHLDREVLVKILYFKTTPHHHEFPRYDVDINRLCISRTGLYVNPYRGVDATPTLLYTLMQQCANKEFQIIDPLIDPHWKFQRAKSLIARGYKLKNPHIIEKEEMNCDCSICQNTVDEDIVCELFICKHKFHVECWRNYLKSKTTNRTTINFALPDLVPCPNCRQKYQQWRVLI